jgi:hypothetical protein
MPDLLETASAWLETMRRSHNSASVTYSRDGESVTLPATIGRTVFRIERDFGAHERVESRDFLLAAEELVLGGAAALPSQGDRIREERGGVTWEYEVMAPGQEPCWRFSDAYRRTLRIHTKLVGREPAGG